MSLDLTIKPTARVFEWYEHTKCVGCERMVLCLHITRSDPFPLCAACLDALAGQIRRAAGESAK